MKSCLICTHLSVCGMMDILWTAIKDIQDYEQTHPKLPDDLRETLAENCVSYIKESKEA